MITGVLFYAFAAVLVVAALGVITSRNPVHAALFLVLAFVHERRACGCCIEAEFLAIVLVLVYVGAVMVLFLFVVMMLDINIEELREGFTRYLPLGVARRADRRGRDRPRHLVPQPGPAVPDARREPLPADYSNTKELGAVLYTEYVYAFEIAAVILLLAIVAAITLTMRQRAGPQGAGHREAGGRAPRGPRAHRQGRSRAESR